MDRDVARGDIYWVDYRPGRGVEQAGRRPALVVQNDRGNASSGATVVVAITSAPFPRVYPFTVALNAGEAGLSRQSHVNCAQMLTIDKRRLGARIGILDADRMREVDDALRYQLAL